MGVEVDLLESWVGVGVEACRSEGMVGISMLMGVGMGLGRVVGMVRVGVRVHISRTIVDRRLLRRLVMCL